MVRRLARAERQHGRRCAPAILRDARAARAKAQPSGRCSGSGTWPGIAARRWRPASGGSACGEAAKQARACRDAPCRRNTSSVRPRSTTRPAYITSTRSVISLTTPRSWVISSSAMPVSATSSASRSRICAWIVTSSAVVGSSAISRSGAAGERHGDHHALALAAGELVRIAARREARLRQADTVEQRRARGSRASARDSRRCRRSGSATCAPIV